MALRTTPGKFALTDTIPFAQLSDGTMAPVNAVDNGDGTYSVKVESTVVTYTNAKSGYISTVAGLAATLAASGSDESDAITLSTVGETYLIAQITGTFNASATGDMTVKCLTSLDGTTYDDSSDPMASGSIPVQAGVAASKTFYFQVYAPYAKIRIENGDATYSITSISVKQYIPPVS